MELTNLSIKVETEEKETIIKDRFKGYCNEVPSLFNSYVAKIIMYPRLTSSVYCFIPLGELNLLQRVESLNLYKPTKFLFGIYIDNTLYNVFNCSTRLQEESYLDTKTLEEWKDVSIPNMKALSEINLTIDFLILRCGSDLNPNIRIHYSKCYELINPEDLDNPLYRPLY